MITIRPDALFQHLEFDKLSNLLLSYCLIGDTKSTYFPLGILTIKSEMDQALHEVLEIKSAYERNELPPLRACTSIADSLGKINIEEFVFELEALIHINQVLKCLEEIHRFFRPGERQTRVPLAYNDFKLLEYRSDLYNQFALIFDESDLIRPDATPELKLISKSIRSKEHEIDQVFRFLLNEYRKQGWLSESGESIRNNRRVVAIQAEYKRKIKGIVHDESTTGRTTYIEPELIIEKNNELFDLEMDYQKEIYRILKMLSAACQQEATLLQSGWLLLLKFDFIRAKALFAAAYHGYRPEIYDRPQLKIKSGRHPLLLLKNQLQGKTTVPFDLVLTGENRILILSGPNAGGKSVAMKATGLIQLMVQAGLLVPVHEASEMGIFHTFLGDIGDQQSLEDDLSTYSSRLLKMKQFLELADDRSLLFIDEFGSGTDPKLGGAIAELILLALNQRKVHGVITTHYSNLKVLAFRTMGLLNGAMIFDTEHLQPTFQLKVGRPGSSYAFEVAYRSGLDPALIEQAKSRINEDQKELEELLIELQRDKLNLEDQLSRAKDKEIKLDKLIKNYEQINSDFELKKRKLKLDQKSWEINAEKSLAKKVENTLKEIKTVKQPGPVHRKLEDTKHKIEFLQQEILTIHSEMKQLGHPHNKPIEVGTYVKMKHGSETGRVISLRKEQAEVAMGSVIINMPVYDLVVAKEPLSGMSEPGKKEIHVEEKKVESSLDLRGMSKSQAIDLLQHYLDRVMLSNMHEVRILHGKGNGVLRELVKTQAKQYKGIKKVAHPPNEAGGDGISILEFS